MKINTYLIQLAITITIIFGGTFIIRYFRTGEFLLDQIIGVGVGGILLISALLWRASKK
ncbi:hypothetical protein [Lysinibacillus telephonicus]|uniref:hypothetical protein n=1 Tax=Lysinibacillus telephonicus TaxID=1714840 RepID=UPI00163B0C2A|nr:hypothetical protein [Lysinibacillus telephonicus]